MSYLPNKVPQIGVDQQITYALVPLDVQIIYRSSKSGDLLIILVIVSLSIKSNWYVPFYSQHQPRPGG